VTVDTPHFKLIVYTARWHGWARWEVGHWSQAADGTWHVTPIYHGWVRRHGGAAIEGQLGHLGSRRRAKELARQLAP
jgi:hypothetical protein